MTFKALVLHKAGEDVSASIQEMDETRLPAGGMLVRVLYSSLNYKDGLAVTGEGKVVKGTYPFVPGIDLAGIVEQSDSEAYRPGEQVIGTGWGLGEEHWGGYIQMQRVQPEWLVPLPAGLSPYEAMAIGTAGLTAMLSVMALEAHGAKPDLGTYVVTGASGGVGSMAVAILATLGYKVAASTGSEEAHDYLRALGASEIIHRDELAGGAKRPLDSARWAGAVDTVGHTTLAALLSTIGRHGSVAVCGLAGGAELHTTVFPFILRGVNLLGIDSNTCPNDLRRRAWDRLARELPKSALHDMAQTIPLAEVPDKSRALLAGDVQGRVVVDVNA
jgi:acrylyl-CoA reductase (NADPH)